jgi:amphi-Trp domain-containing protein
LSTVAIANENAAASAMSTDDDFRHESVQDRKSIVKYLQALTAGIEQGQIAFGSGEHSLTLEPSGMLELQVRAKRKGGRVKLGIKLYWREDDEEPGGDSLQITAGSRP